MKLSEEKRKTILNKLWKVRHALNYCSRKDFEKEWQSAKDLIDPITSQQGIEADVHPCYACDDWEEYQANYCPICGRKLSTA